MYRHFRIISTLFLFGVISLTSCEMNQSDLANKEVRVHGEKQEHQNRDVTFLRKQFHGCKAHR